MRDHCCAWSDRTRWAIRNCGLLLLRSLVDCVFGTSENKSSIEAGWDGKTTRIHYHKYPTLPGVLVCLLKSGQEAMRPGLQNTRGVEAVFPALDMIRRAGPPDSLRSEIQELILGYLRSPVWHVREMAARTLCSCLLHEHWLDVVEALLQSSFPKIDHPGGHNQLHGAYMVLKFVFERMAVVMPQGIAGERLLRCIRSIIKLTKTSDNLNRIEAILWQATTLSLPAFRCHEILAAHIEVINLVALHELDHRIQGSDIDRIAAAVLSDPNVSVLVSASQTSPLLRTQLGKLLVYHHVQSRDAYGLRGIVTETASVDVNAASAMLEAVSTFDDQLDSAELCQLYLDICLGSSSCELRTAALNRLADVLTRILTSNMMEGLPASVSLIGLWADLREGSLNPSLSNAIIRSSGPILSAIMRQETGQDSSSRLARWSGMMAAAVKDEQVRAAKTGGTSEIQVG